MDECIKYLEFSFEIFNTEKQLQNKTHSSMDLIVEMRQYFLLIVMEYFYDMRKQL